MWIWTFKLLQSDFRKDLACFYDKTVGFLSQAVVILQKLKVFMPNTPSWNDTLSPFPPLSFDSLEETAPFEITAYFKLFDWCWKQDLNNMFISIYELSTKKGLYLWEIETRKVKNFDYFRFRTLFKGDLRLRVELQSVKNA